MKLHEFIKELDKLKEDLLKYNDRINVEVIASAPHTCCSNGGESPCYQSDEETTITNFSIAEHLEYNHKTKQQELKRIVIYGNK